VDQQSQPSSQPAPAPGQLGSGTFVVPGIDDAMAPQFFTSRPTVKPETLLQMNTLKDGDPTDVQGDLSAVDATHRLVADNGGQVRRRGPPTVMCGRAGRPRNFRFPISALRR
jgi:hypothetical protein